MWEKDQQETSYQKSPVLMHHGKRSKHETSSQRQPKHENLVVSAGVPSLTPLGLRADLSPGTVFLLQLTFTCVRIMFVVIWMILESYLYQWALCRLGVKLSERKWQRDMMNLFQNKLSLGTADCHRAALEIDMDNVAICSTSYNVVPDFMDIVNIFLVNNHDTEVIPKIKLWYTNSIH